MISDPSSVYSKAFLQVVENLAGQISISNMQEELAGNVRVSLLKEPRLSFQYTFNRK